MQCHPAQIPPTKVQLDEGRRAEAIAIVAHNLDTFDDWIVTILTLGALAVFARAAPAVRTRLVECLYRFGDSRTSR